MPQGTPNPLFRRLGQAALLLTLVLLSVGVYGLYFSYTTEVRPDVAEHLAELKRISWMCLGVGAACLGTWLWGRRKGHV
ncbi:MAG: hypothetical protein KIS92_09960 [Planctomycetota bacterium]|nr:hypothetical protein [Planctomycetota bacterium]